MCLSRETVKTKNKKKQPFFASQKGFDIEKSSNAYSGNTSAALCSQCGSGGKAAFCLGHLHKV